MVGGIGMIVFTLQQEDGQVIIAHSESLAEKLVDVARTNEQFYKILISITQGSAWGALLLESAAITGALLANHGIDLGAMMRNRMGKRHAAEQEQSNQIAA
jgi:hypothetical protein